MSVQPLTDFAGAIPENFLLETNPLLRQALGSIYMDVKLPKLGEGADSGVVVGIFVNVGDTVAKDQAILELENEKAVASIPSTAAGVVEKIHVKAGDKVSIGQKLITLAGGGGAPAAAPAPKPAPEK